MRNVWLVGSLGLCLAAGILVLGQNRADAAKASPSTVASTPVAITGASDLTAGPASTQRDVPLAKRCSFNSDCPYGKCRHGKCGGCSFNSDCKGWGKCRHGQCGGCSFNSDCKGFGGCTSGHCKRSPY